jgi:outer membrane protein TolC
MSSMSRTAKSITMIVALTGAFAHTEEHSKELKATSALSVDAAIVEGLDRSPEIRRARAAQSESEWKRFETLGEGFLPKISGNAHHYFGETYEYTNINFGGSILNFPGFYPTNTAGIDVMVPIFDGFSNVRNLEAASLNEDAAVAELSQAEFQLRQDIRLAFYKALASSELLAVADQNVRTLEDHLRQVDAQKHGGVATSYDVLRVQVQLSDARADQIDAQDNFATSRRKLTELMGLESDDRPLTGVLPIPQADRVKNLKFNETTVDRSDLRALNLRAEAAEKAQNAASTWYVPSIYVGGEYNWYDAQVFTTSVQDTGHYYNSYNVGLFLKWNLFDGGVSIARQQQASYRTIQAEKSAEAAKLKVPYDFEYWKRRYLSHTDHYISKKFDITRSEESVRLAKEEEKAGTRTSTETLDAELDLFRAKAGVVNALMNAAEAEIRLELALGREI